MVFFISIPPFLIKKISLTKTIPFFALGTARPFSPPFYGKGLLASFTQKESTEGEMLRGVGRHPSRWILTQGSFSYLSQIQKFCHHFSLKIDITIFFNCQIKSSYFRIQF